MTTFRNIAFCDNTFSRGCRGAKTGRPRRKNESESQCTSCPSRKETAESAQNKNGNEP